MWPRIPMALRRLPGTDLRVRRGRRQDLAQVQALLGGDTARPASRFFRRLVADLGGDVYVAEDAGGEIVGLVALTYARSLTRGGRSALLDGVRARRDAARPVIEGLVQFAEDRARRRGCHRLAAWLEPEDGELRAALQARGYHAGDLLVTQLTGSA